MLMADPWKFDDDMLEVQDENNLVPSSQTRQIFVRSYASRPMRTRAMQADTRSFFLRDARKTLGKPLGHL